MKFQHLLWSFITTLLLTSCGDFTEEITINEDGSGKMEFYTDLVPFMSKTMAAFASMGEESDQLSEEELDKKVENMIWEKMGAEIDSVIDYTDKIPPEIKNDPVKYEIVKRMTGFMKGGKKEGKINTGIAFPYKDNTDLANFISVLEESQEKDPQARLMGDGKSKYTTTKNSFRRTIVYNNEDKEASQIPMEAFKDMKYYVIINTPKKIKNITGSNIKSQTDKQVIFEYNIIDYIEGNYTTDFTVGY